MKRAVTFLSLLALAPLAGRCDDNMSFHGILVEPPCTISNGQTIEVRFGNDLGVNKIDGNNYIQPVNYQITCGAGYTTSGLAVVVETTRQATFVNAAIQTNKAGLGIRILVNSQPVNFGERIAVDDAASPPVIQAVPVQDPKVTLSEGPFEATLTLRADYM